MAKAKPVSSGRRSTGQSTSRKRFQPRDAELRAEPVVALARRVVSRPDGADGERHRHHRVDRDDHDRRERQRRRRMAQQHEPAGADDDRRHDQHEAGAGIRRRVRATSPWRDLRRKRQRLPRRDQRQRQRHRQAAPTAWPARGWSAVACRTAPRPRGGRDRPASPAVDRGQPSARRRTAAPATISAAFSTVSARPTPTIAARRDRQIGVAGGVGAEPRQSEHDDDGQRDLQHGQRHRARGIEVETQRLVDRDLQRGRAPARRPASARW